ncbi:MAG: NfeD family protein [Verrucomicrobiae bacterium]|nr:NfeD family protein [Verrucomicrobiae bacterium]
MESWHWWLIAAIILMIAEVLTSDFLLATFGIACLGGSIAAGFEASLTGQLLSFALTAILCLAFIRPAVKRWLYQSTTETSRTNVDSMIGRKGTVADPVSGENAPGRVKIGGEEWRAISADGSMINPGAVVEIVSLDGATVTVRPLT